MFDGCSVDNGGGGGGGDNKEKEGETNFWSSSVTGIPFSALLTFSHLLSEEIKFQKRLTTLPNESAKDQTWIS